MNHDELLAIAEADIKADTALITATKSDIDILAKQIKGARKRIGTNKRLITALRPKPRPVKDEA